MQQRQKRQRPKASFAPLIGALVWIPGSPDPFNLEQGSKSAQTTLKRDTGLWLRPEDLIPSAGSEPGVAEQLSTATECRGVPLFTA